MDAAARLFAEQGLADTTMAQIADAVGIARSALYRYFPSKEHILLASFEWRLPQVVAAANAAAAGPGTPLERLERWLSFQIDYVLDPAHEVGRRLQGELHSLPPDMQARLARGHARLSAGLERLVVAVLQEVGDDRDPRLATALVNGLTHSAAAWAIDAGDGVAAKRALLDATRRLLT